MAGTKRTPNLQNMPVFAKDDPRSQFGRDLRRMFSGGPMLIEADYSQIERRVMERTRLQVLGFSGEYRWMSNFAPVVVTMGDHPYVSVEHAYQAAKSLDLQYRAMIQVCAKPGDAKRYGKRAVLRADWEEVKVGIMLDLVRQKFQNEPTYRDLLKALPLDVEIIELNTWGDRFWGKVAMATGELVGQNKMGEILMQVLAELEED